MQFRKYTEKQLREAVKTSTSIAQALKKLDVIPAGGNYAVIKKYIKELNLNTSHFKGQGWSKGKKFQPKRPIEDYLSNKQSIQSDSLKKRLLKEGYFEHKCYKCDNDTWNGESIPIELEHIDGNNKNNNLDNLTILCPNCHAQTPTYRRSKSSL